MTGSSLQTVTTHNWELCISALTRRPAYWNASPIPAIEPAQLKLAGVIPEFPKAGRTRSNDVGRGTRPVGD